jgi:two-component system, OmpR family, manganese sensing response regulator
VAHYLIVEDDTVLADTLSEWFEMNSEDVDLADNGADGLAKMQSGSYDLILLDWQLPAMEGIDVCRSYRTAGGGSPILMFTGMRDLEFQEKALDAGADDVLAKPFDISQLAERVRLLTRR